MHNKEKCLITGSRGFLGTQLYYWLSDGRHDIETINRRDSLDLIKDFQPDIVYHLAAAGSKKGDYTNEEILKTNIGLTQDLLSACRDIPYRAFINFSSSSVYGKKDKPMKESDDPAPEFLYAESKVVAEAFCGYECFKYKKPIVSIRPFSIVGPKMQETKLIPTVIRSIKNDIPLNLIDGNHDFLDVRDLLSALDIIIYNIDQLKGGVVNIGSGIQTSNIEVVRICEEVLNKKAIISEVEFKHNHSQVDSKKWQADITKIKRLGWEPKITLRESIEGMI